MKVKFKLLGITIFSFLKPCGLLKIIYNYNNEYPPNIAFTRRRRVVPYYFPRFGSNVYKGFLKRFAYYDNKSDKKKKRSADTTAEDDEGRYYPDFSSIPSEKKNNSCSF